MQLPYFLYNVRSLVIPIDPNGQIAPRTASIRNTRIKSRTCTIQLYSYNHYSRPLHPEDQDLVASVNRGSGFNQLAYPKDPLIASHTIIFPKLYPRLLMDVYESHVRSTNQLSCR
jgi:hypothetical protein